MILNPYIQGKYCYPMVGTRNLRDRIFYWALQLSKSRYPEIIEKVACLVKELKFVPNFPTISFLQWQRLVIFVIEGIPSWLLPVVTHRINWTCFRYLKKTAVLVVASWIDVYLLPALPRQLFCNECGWKGTKGSGQGRLLALASLKIKTDDLILYMFINWGKWSSKSRSGPRIDHRDLKCLRRG